MSLPDPSSTDAATPKETSGQAPGVEFAPTPASTQLARPVADTLAIEELKAQAASYDIRELTRNTEQYVGNVVSYYGRVLQVIENKALFGLRVTYTLRFAVDNDFDRVILARLIYEDGQGFRPLEDDRLIIWGIVEGRETYQTVLGAQVTLPAVRIQHVETEGGQTVTGGVDGAVTIPSPSPPTIEVLSHTTYQTGSYYYINGEVQNRSDYPVRFVKIVATLRDANSHVIGAEYSFAQLNTIPAGGKSPFSIGIRSWEAMQSYDLAVEGNRGDPPRQDLVIRSHGSTVDGTQLRIFGEVENAGVTAAEFVKLVITLYDGFGRVIGSDITLTALSTIPPGGTSPFSTSILHWAGFTHYTIQVEGQ